MRIEHADKDTNRTRKFKRMLSFLFVDQRELFVMKLSFEELCYYQQVLILKFAFGIEKLPGLSRNRPC